MQAAKDIWQGRFTPGAMQTAGAGSAMYRQCVMCGGHSLEGSQSAHARWCDNQQAERKALTLAAFDTLESAERRAMVDRRAVVRSAAQSAL